MKDNKKKKDRRKYPQGSAASHAGQNSGNHGGHAGHPRSRSSKLLKNRKTLLMDLVSSKNYEPMRLKDIAMLLQVPKAKRSELAEVMEILVKEGKNRCDLRRPLPEEPRCIHNDGKTGKKRPPRRRAGQKRTR